MPWMRDRLDAFEMITLTGGLSAFIASLPLRARTGTRASTILMSLRSSLCFLSFISIHRVNALLSSPR
ncbi:hypothetical protein SCHPADRAFT_763121 [Schizopora paradoxa]|uniref:Uncharacterized protein n=1 Tax=Schizopora paradoxa TaxID=27342 RepID=A0A0H2QXH6_9AGAM|nr:hypothetical protein SCHPADRAFT_763121 [Schizopora paradoxa]